MEVRYNVTGPRRKELAQTISRITGAKAVYKFMPTCAYEIDFFTLSKEGTLIFSDMSDTEIVEAVLEGIAQAGFECEPAEDCDEEQPAEEGADDAAQDAEETAESEDAANSEKTETDGPIGLTVTIPLEKVNAANLTKLLDAKGALIKKALGADDIRIEIGEDAVSFPWFSELPDADTAKAYTHFIAALCQMSREQKRVTATAKDVDNEKYAFRCLLLRLGFIGAEYKGERKILLQNLSGSSAFKGGERHAVSE
ncbi:MAG: virulence protein [Clostridiales bacterium]|nr:virulence protein [Clostridiales bacterium]